MSYVASVRRPREILETTLAVAPPFVVAAGWIRWALHVVDLQERAIRPLSGLAYATFVQLVWSHNHGLGWVQTVHRGYADDWRWGGHYTPILFLTGWLSSFSTSPWGLARVQVVAVGLGCFSAWLLGFAEARLLGGLAALLIYAGSGGVAQIALADYQDFAFCIPLFPLVVWAARHRSLPEFLFAAVALGSTREELVVLLPLVGLSGGWRRAVWGLGVALGYGAVYQSLGAPPYPNPLSSITEWQASRGLDDPSRFVGIDWNLYGTVASAGWPWLLAAPLTALPGLPVILFHHQDPTSVKSVVSPAVHHFSPLVGAAVAAGIVGAARVMRLDRWLAVGVLVAVAGTTAWSFRSWDTPLRTYGLRVQRAEESPAWQLLAQVPDDAVLLVPDALAPAAAMRRNVVTPDSVGDRIPASLVDWAIDDGRYTGEVVATSGRWRLLHHPVVTADHTPEVTGGRQ